MTGHGGRGRALEQILQAVKPLASTYVCPPEPSIMRTNDTFHVGRGRAAHVFAQLRSSVREQTNTEKDFDENSKPTLLSESPTKQLKEQLVDTSVLSSNKIFIRCQIGMIYKYEIEFMPHIESRTSRFNYVSELRQYIGPQLLYDGSFIYLPQRLQKDEMAFKKTSDTDTDGPDEIAIRLMEILSIDQMPIDLVNIIFKSAVNDGLDFVRNNRRYYDKNKSAQLLRYRLHPFEGKFVSIEREKDGLSMYVDFATNTTITCYEELERLYMVYDVTDDRDMIRQQFVNRLVLTRYDNKTQRIDDIYWDSTPLNTKITISEDEQVTIQDYFEKKFDIVITDLNQPLLIYCPRRPGERFASEPNYLVPELCYLTDLTDKSHQDSQAQKTSRSLDSVARRSELLHFTDMLKRNSSTIKYLKQWGIVLPEQDSQRSSKPIVNRSQTKPALNLTTRLNSRTNHRSECDDTNDFQKKHLSTTEDDDDIDRDNDNDYGSRQFSKP
ncbi:unnamed protein product, partial [Didymodactylos carnosus]